MIYSRGNQLRQTPGRGAMQNHDTEETPPLIPAPNLSERNACYLLYQVACNGHVSGRCSVIGQTDRESDGPDTPLPDMRPGRPVLTGPCLR